MRARTLLLFVLSFALYCCGTYAQNARPVGVPGTLAPPLQPEYRIQAGDKLNIKMFYNPDLNQEVTVRPDGKISLSLLHDVDAVGLTPAELTDHLTEGYGKHLQQPEVTVVVTGFGGAKIYVGGEVGSGGVKDLVGPTTILQAIAMAGGFRDTARLNEVVIMRRGEDNKPYLITVDAKKAMKGIDLSQDIYVQAYDLVLVPRSNIAEVNLWVEQYIARNVGELGSFYQWYYMTK
jgi:protein involved in polysaccharide export with SLBB domain